MIRSRCAACAEDCTDAEHVPANAAIARGLKVPAHATVCFDCSTRTPRREMAEVVYRALLARLAALGFGDAPALGATGDALLDRRPVTRETKDLACACWLAADGHYAGAAEAMAPDGDGAAWVAREATAQGVEVIP